MKTHKLHKLYKILWEQIKDQEILEYGICYEIKMMDLSLIEKLELQKHLYELKPTSSNDFKDFYFHHSFCDNLWWWHVGTIESTKQRKMFIQRLIEITEPKVVTRPYNN